MSEKESERDRSIEREHRSERTAKTRRSITRLEKVEIGERESCAEKI